MATLLGQAAELYYKVDGQSGGGSWIELTNVNDVTLAMEAGEADVTTRANEGWRATIATLKEGSIEFEMIWDTSDAGFTAIKDAYFDNNMIGLWAIDQTGGQGLKADFSITNFSRTEPLEEAIKVAVTAKITRSDDAPTWAQKT